MNRIHVFIIGLTLSLAAGCLTFMASRQTPEFLLEPGHDDAYFGADISRITANLTDRKSSYARTSVHPLAPLFLTMPVYAMSLVFHIPRLLAMHLLIAINATFLSGILFAILYRITGRLLDSLLFFLLAGSSAACWAWLSIPESFTFGSTTILLAVLAASLPLCSKRLWTHYAIGVATMAITITNWMAGILYSVCFLGWKRALSVALHVFALVTLLWGAQKYVFPSSEFILGSTNEMSFLNKKGVRQTTLKFFLHAYATPDPVVSRQLKNIHPKQKIMSINASSMSAFRRIRLDAAYVAWGALLVLGAVALRRATGVDPAFRLLLALLLGGQYALHLVYSGQTFIHSLHWLPLMVVACSVASQTPFRKVALSLAALTVVLGLSLNVPFRQKSMDLITGFSTTGGTAASSAPDAPEPSL